MVENGGGGAAEKWRRWRKRWQSYATVRELDAKGDDYKMACLNSAMSDGALDLIDSLPLDGGIAPFFENDDRLLSLSVLR